MTQLVHWFAFLTTIILVPPLALGFTRKLKARLQNRVGAPIYQPLLDMARLFKKAETISETTSWVFRTAAVINFAGMVVLAFLVPWISYKPIITSDDLFLVVYLFALCRFFTVLSALDAGSVFGGFGASREVTLSLLVEPAVVLALVSLGVIAKSTDLAIIFSYGQLALGNPVLWLLSASGLFMASLVELSRMPVDDPTTHLELTMVHEAMTLENSGRNLALIEYAHWLKLTMLLGVCAQCLLHACYCFAGWHPHAGMSGMLGILSLVFLMAMLVLVALIESNTVKLRWTKIPEFIAYSVAMSLLGMLVAVGSK